MGKNLDNIKEKRVPINLGGKEYLVKFGFEAFALLEEKFGTLELAMKKFEEGKMTTLCTLLWAGLQDGLEDGEVLTEKQVSRMLELDSLGGVVEVLTRAINAALPEEAPKEAKNQKNALPIPTQK